MATSNRSDMTTTLKQNDGKVWLQCHKCNSETCHAIVVVLIADDHNDGCEIYAKDRWETLQCAGCREISFRNQWTSSEGDGDWTVEHLWPLRSATQRQLNLRFLAPQSIVNVYEETYQALLNDQRTLCGIGIRTLVEAVCRDRQATGKNLAARIDDLVKKKLLAQPDAELLHATRLLGNKNTHESHRPSQDVLEAAMVVAHHLLNTVYVVPSKTSQLPKAGNNKGSEKNAPAQTSADPEPVE